MNDREKIARCVAEFIGLDPLQASEQRFNDVAREVFRYQYAHNLWVRRLADARQVSPEDLKDWRALPAMPAEMFKETDLSCTTPGRARAVFYSSGTTGRDASRHFMNRDALALYETSIRRGFGLALPHAPRRLWALMPSPQVAPHSSLSHMLGTLNAERFFWESAVRDLPVLASAAEPITLFGTAFALMHLLENETKLFPLPPGSLVIETGGFKGRSREVPRAEFYGLLSARFDVPTARIWSEYGMSEMASQFYGQGLSEEKRGPHWTRTRAIDLSTGQDAAPGMPGALWHVDLANLNSVCCLQTADWGTITPQGFLLHGRAPGAVVRGCSLLAEQMLG